MRPRREFFRRSRSSNFHLHTNGINSPLGCKNETEASGKANCRLFGRMARTAGCPRAAAALPSPSAGRCQIDASPARRRAGFRQGVGGSKDSKKPTPAAGRRRASRRGRGGCGACCSGSGQGCSSA
ncbi:hypothetical protein A33M_2165 [Rhodovulum sp. PH10]|nr:hypothetical protein A33M_2165 [Rhodovulum sp. PH10]